MTNEEKLKQAGLNKSYWGKIILKAEKSGSFTKKEQDEALDYRYCACGKAGIPEEYREKPTRSPKDEILRDWGAEFYAAVMGPYFDDATDWLIKIEQRVVELYHTKKDK